MSNSSSLFTGNTRCDQQDLLTQRYNRILNGINSIISIDLKGNTEEEMRNDCLSVVLEITGSQIGFIGEVDKDGLLNNITVSDLGWNQRNKYDKSGHKRLHRDFILNCLYGCAIDSKMSVIDSKKGFFTNDPLALSDRIGSPPGNSLLTSFLGVPIFEKGKAVGMLAVANCENGYSSEQLEDLEAIVPAVVQTLRRIKEERERRQTENTLLDSYEQMQTQAEELHIQSDGLLMQNEDLQAKYKELQAQNDDLQAQYEKILEGNEVLNRNDECLTIAKEAAAFGIYNYNVPSGIIQWDSRVRELWGVGQEEIITYDTFIAGLHPEDRTATQEKVDQALDPAGSGKYYAEYRVINKIDGMERWVAATGHVFFKQGKAVRLVGTVQDTTERKRIETTLQESEERLLLAQQVAKVGTFEWNIQTGVNIWTPELEVMYGLLPGEFGKTQQAWEQLVYPDDRQKAISIVDQAFQTGEPAEGEWRVIWSDGSVHWITGRFQVFRDEAGQSLRLTGVNIDITERKQAEEALQKAYEQIQAQSEELQVQNEELQAQSKELQEANDALAKSEAHFRTMANAIPQLAWIAQADGYIYWYNDRWYAYTDTTPEQMEGWGWQSVHDPTVLPKVLEKWKVSIASGQPFDMEFPLRGADGIFRPFLTRVMPLKDAKGQVLQWFGTNTDVTERKQEEYRILRYNRILEGINQIFSNVVQAKTEEELGNTILSVALDVTGGGIGFVNLLGNDGLMHDIAISEGGWKQCIMYDQTGHRRPPGNFIVHGLYGHVVKSEKGFFTNSPQSHPASIGLPHGHPSIKAFLAVPLIEDGKAVGMLGVGNRKDGYSHEQLEDLEAIAPAVTQALIRKREEQKRNLAEEAIRESRIQLENELIDTKLLQTISSELLPEDNIQELYEKIIDAAMKIMHSDFASMQMLYPERGNGGELRLLTFRGFSPEAAKFWEWVRADSESSCGIALRTGKRVISPNVENCDFMDGSDDQATYIQTGIRAVQTTPLVSRTGKLVGMISTHWRNPHEPSDRGLRLLEILARQAADLIERKQAEEALKEAKETLEEKIKERTSELEKAYIYNRSLIEASLDPLVTIRHDGRIMDVNVATEQVTGYSRSELIGTDFSNFFTDPVKARTGYQQVFINGKVRDYHLEILHRAGHITPVLYNASVYRDENGEIIGVFAAARDITESKKAAEYVAKIEIARKQEIHHRIKNNLQVISSLLDLQADKFNNREDIKDSEVLRAFKESQDRVISMALIHEELHKGGEIDTLNFSHYIKELADNLFLTYMLGNNRTSLDMDIEKDIFFDMDIAVPLGILTNELISNSLKYAFKGRDHGEIRVKLHREENRECKIEDRNSTAYVLSISDNGIGIPEDLEIEDLDSLGLQLVTTLVDQLDGELELKRDNGTKFIIRFTVTEKNNQASEATQEQLVEK